MSIDERYEFVVGQTFGGWHHVGNVTRDERHVSFCVYAHLATYDFNQLTKLVLACHAVFIRAEIRQGGPGTVKICLSPRLPAIGPALHSFEQHPTLDDLIFKAQELKKALL